MGTLQLQVKESELIGMPAGRHCEWNEAILSHSNEIATVIRPRRRPRND